MDQKGGEQEREQNGIYNVIPMLPILTTVMCSLVLIESGQLKA